MLERLFGGLLVGEWDDFTEDELVSTWKHWKYKYLQFEEELTFEESEQIERALAKLWNTLDTKYSGHGEENIFI